MIYNSRNRLPTKICSGRKTPKTFN